MVYVMRVHANEVLLYHKTSNECPRHSQNMGVRTRDVTKFEFKFVQIQIQMFELRMFSTDSTNVLSALLSNANSWKNSCSTTDFICSAQTARERRQTFFPNSIYYTNYHYWMCNI